jgi:signal peptidase II
VRRAGTVLSLIILLTTIGCDRATKHLATTHLANSPAQFYLANTLRLEYAENPGAFLSFGDQLPDWERAVLFKGGVGLALVAILVVALKQKWTGISLLGATLTFAGGVSNLLDRIAQGSVVDFMSVGVGRLRTGIFNVADVAIMLGAAMIAIGCIPRKPAITRED